MTILGSALRIDGRVVGDADPYANPKNFPSNAPKLSTFNFPFSTFPHPFPHKKTPAADVAARSRVFFHISPIFRSVSCRASARSAVRYGEKATLSSP